MDYIISIINEYTITHAIPLSIQLHHASDHVWNTAGLSFLRVWYLSWKELFLHLENSYSSAKTQRRIPFP